ncbi:MAG: YHS domain-containing protein [Patescibacteria group bacterium]|nr:YHS domain-containing protein [Patescibacteria group bacterium]
MVKDPVCGMSVDENSEFKSEYNGKIYYFCSKICKDQFDVTPQGYVGEEEK